MVMMRRPRTATTWWAGQRSAVAAAVAEAEAATGHQIVVVVRRLGQSPAASADRIARRYRGATVVVCVDPVGRTFEIRWHGQWAAPAGVVDELSRMLADGRLADAVALVGRVIPRGDGRGRDLPDIVDEES